MCFNNNQTDVGQLNGSRPPSISSYDLAPVIVDLGRYQQRCQLLQFTITIDRIRHHACTGKFEKMRKINLKKCLPAPGIEPLFPFTERMNSLLVNQIAVSIVIPK